MLKKITTEHYRLLHPKMAVFITSIGKTGKPNVMTCAWTTPVSDEPSIIAICIWNKSHTAKLIRQTKQFAINIPSKKLLKAIWLSGKFSGKNTDKFKKSGLRHEKASIIKVPLVEGCIGYIECKLIKTIPAGECFIFLGKAINARADDKYFKKGGWRKNAGIPFHAGGGKMKYI